MKGCCEEAATVSVVTTIRCDKAKAKLSEIAQSIEGVKARIVVQRNLLTGARAELLTLL